MRRETKIQHHIDDHLQRYLKNVSLKLFRKVEKDEIDFLVLAGPKGEKGEIVTFMKQHLHSYLRNRVIGYFPGDSRVEDDVLESRFREVIDAFKEKEGKKLLEQLIGEASRPSGLGVLGVQSTLQALRNGQVRELVVSVKAQRAGWICPDDYYLSEEKGECPVCNSTMKVTEDLIGHMIWEAIDQNAEIRFLETDDETFVDKDVGAILRFRK